MKINNEKIKALAGMLHRQNEEELLAVYYGVAEVLVTIYMEKVGSSRTIAENKVYLRRMISDVAEIAIVDRTMLERACLSVYGFKYTNKYTAAQLLELRWDFKSYEDVVGLYVTMSKEVIATINKHFNLYRDALTYMSSAFDDIFSDYSLGD